MSYANNQKEEVKINEDGSMQLEIKKKYIDMDTLSRLIEEAREEDERMSVMNEMHSITDS